MQRTYSPEALAQVRDAFAPQPDGQSCGPAALRHGLLLGGLSAPVHTLASLLETGDNEGTDYKTLLEALRRFGFKVEPEPRPKPKNQPTAAFLEGMRPELEQGAFLLPCVYGGGHWVCLGAWDGERAWVVDSYDGDDGSLNFSGWTAQEFDDWDWEDCVNVVRPGNWANQYQAWLPARRALLRMPVDGGGANPVTMEAAVRNAAEHYLSDADYDGYSELGLYLPGGVEVTVEVENPGEEVLVGEEGEGERRVLVFRRAAGTLRRQSAPELVLRAGKLCAAQLR
jgi:hypothetical protein